MNVDSGYVASANGSAADPQSTSSVAFPGWPPGADLVRSRPEVLVGAAFAGGMLAAFLLRRLGR